jgi:hypothetical protein
VASLFGICLSAWATLLAFSLLFPDRATKAADSIHGSPVKMGLLGTGITALLFVGGILLLQQPLPLVKLVGWMLLLANLSLAAMGCSGLATIMAGRVQKHEPNLSAYAALMRGAALVVVPGILPFFGWFLIAPAVLLVGVGAGTKALRVIHSPVAA